MTLDPNTVRSPLAVALAAAQAEMQDPERTKKGQVRGRGDYRYAGLDDLLRALRPVLSKHGLAITQRQVVDEHGTLLVTELRHASGEILASSWRLTCTGTPQERGSELTYGRRYTLEGLAGVAPIDEDDDGAAASQKPEPQKEQRKPPTKAEVEPKPEPRPAPKLPEPAAAERSWPEDEPAYRSAMRSRGVDYEIAAELAKTRPGNATPAEMTRVRRERYLQWLETSDGRAAYKAYALEGERLEAALADLHVALGEHLPTLTECANAAGLPVSDDGPTIDGAPEPMLRRYAHQLRQRLARVAK